MAFPLAVNHVRIFASWDQASCDDVGRPLDVALGVGKDKLPVWGKSLVMDKRTGQEGCNPPDRHLAAKPIEEV